MAKFVDQTGGVPYPFGAKWPSAHASYVQNTVVPKAVNGDGASYTLTEDLLFLEGSGSYELHADNLDVTNIPTITGYSESRWHPLLTTQASTGWAFNPSTFRWDNSSSAAFLLVPLTELVNGQTMTGWTVRYEGASGHAADPITTTMPQVRLYRMSHTADTSEILETVTDTVTGRDAYEDPHDISSTLSGVSIPNRVVNLATYSYMLMVIAEASPDFVTGGRLLGVQTTQLITQVRA